MKIHPNVSKMIFNIDKNEKVHDFQRAFPTIILLLSSIGFYVWMAPRGFEFTDESFYFLNYIHWSDTVRTVSFFGAYFEIPFRIFGQSIESIRIFSLFLLLAGSAFFSREMLLYTNRYISIGLDRSLTFTVVAMSSSLLYFGFRGAVRAPSYDLLSLFLMLVSTGIIFHLLRRKRYQGTDMFFVFLYGLTVGACSLTKATTCVFLIICHLLIFLLANKDWTRNYLAKIFILAIAGFCLNYLILQIIHPQWISSLFEGIGTVASDGRHSTFLLLNWMRWQIQAVMVDFLPWAIAVSFTVHLMLKHTTMLDKSVSLASFLIAVIAICSFFLVWRDWTRFRLPVLGFVFWLLWRIERENHEHEELSFRNRIGLAGILFVFPIIFSIGTDTGILSHCQMAMVFPIVAVMLQLFRLQSIPIISRNTFLACSLILCLPALIVQIRTAFDVTYAFRQLSPLIEQTQEIRVGPVNNVLLVDPRTGDDLKSLINAAKAADFKPNDKILDFSGVGPGLTYALAGQPVGTIWQISELTSSEAASARLISQLPIETLNNAWILSADGYPRAISGGISLISTRIGHMAHLPVATVSIRVNVNYQETIPVTIWKPVIASRQRVENMPL